jgi:hypothetical protein
MKPYPKRPRGPQPARQSDDRYRAGQKPDRDPTPEEQGKDPAAVAMGRAMGASELQAPISMP